MRKNIGHIKCVTCVALAGERSSVFTRANAEGRNLIPVVLSEVQDDGLHPTVEQLKGNATITDKKPIFGFYYAYGEGGRVTILIEGTGIPVARPTNAAAFVAANKGRGIVAGGAGVNGTVIEGNATGTRAVNERGEITGGNTSTGTDDNPAFYRVNFRGA